MLFWTRYIPDCNETVFYASDVLVSLALIYFSRLEHRSCRQCSLLDQIDVLPSRSCTSACNEIDSIEDLFCNVVSRRDFASAILSWEVIVSIAIYALVDSHDHTRSCKSCCILLELHGSRHVWSRGPIAGLSTTYPSRSYIYSRS